MEYTGTRFRGNNKFSKVPGLQYDNTGKQIYSYPWKIIAKIHARKNTQDYPEITSGRTTVENSPAKIISVYSKAVRTLITVALKKLNSVWLSNVVVTYLAVAAHKLWAILYTLEKTLTIWHNRKPIQCIVQLGIYNVRTVDGRRSHCRWTVGTLYQTTNTFCGTWYLPHSRVHKTMVELCSNFGDSAITKGQISYFS